MLLDKARAALGKLDCARDASREAVPFTDFLVRDEEVGGRPVSKLARKECMNAFFFRGEGQHYRGEWAEAEAAFARALELERRYEEEHGDEDIYAARVFRYANYQFDRGEHTASFERLTRAQRICQRSPAGRDQDMAYNGYLLARIHTTRGEHDEVRGLLSRALADCWQLAMIDGRIVVHLALAELAPAEGHTAECDQHLSRAEELCAAEDVRRYRAECLLARAHYHAWRG